MTFHDDRILIIGKSSRTPAIDTIIHFARLTRPGDLRFPLSHFDIEGGGRSEFRHQVTQAETT